MTKQERENFKGCYVESINNVIRDAVEITEMSGIMFGHVELFTKEMQ